MGKTVFDDCSCQGGVNARRAKAFFADDWSPAQDICCTVPGDHAWEDDAYFKHSLRFDFLRGSKENPRAADIYGCAFTPGDLAAGAITEGCLDREPLRSPFVLGDAPLGGFRRFEH